MTLAQERYQGPGHGGFARLLTSTPARSSSSSGTRTRPVWASRARSASNSISRTAAPSARQRETRSSQRRQALTEPRPAPSRRGRPEADVAADPTPDAAPTPQPESSMPPPGSPASLALTVASDAASARASRVRPPPSSFASRRAHLHPRCSRRCTALCHHLRRSRLKHRGGPSLAISRQFFASLERRAGEVPHGRVHEAG